MDIPKYFSNVVLAQFKATGIPLKVYVNGEYLIIPDVYEISDPLLGSGMTTDGHMVQFDYREIDHLLVGGNVLDLETYSKAMAGDTPEGDKEEEEKEKEEEEETTEESVMPSLTSLFEVSEDEVEAEIEAAEAEIDAAKAKEKAAKAAVKDKIKAAKDKIKAAKVQSKVATESIIKQTLSLIKEKVSDKEFKEIETALKQIKSRSDAQEFGKKYNTRLIRPNIKDLNDLKAYDKAIKDLAGFSLSGAKRQRAKMDISKLINGEGEGGGSAINEDYDRAMDRKYGRDRDYTNIEVRDIHFQTDPDELEQMKLTYGYNMGGMTTREKIADADYELKRFRKSINYGNGTDVNVFIPDSYDAMTSKLMNGPHQKASPKVNWNDRKYEEWIDSVAAEGGAQNAFDMAQNAKMEPGLIDWVKKNRLEFGDVTPLERIQYDIEAMAESIDEGDGLWANIHAKRKRGEKPARKGSKAYKAAKKAGDKINKESVNEDHMPGPPYEYDNVSEPYSIKVGDMIQNTNTSCPHHGSKGIVKQVMDMPNDIGKIVKYIVMNQGDNYRPGDSLTKTIDQLEPMR